MTVVLSLAAVVAIWFAARGAGGDRRAFAVAVVASLVATPLVWMHYLLLLYVPIALYRPRLSGLWFLPLLLWADADDALARRRPGGSSSRSSSWRSLRCGLWARRPGRRSAAPA